MRFLRRIIGSISRDLRARLGTTSTGHCRSRMELETLESRNLLSIRGVSLAFGNLAITATKNSGNVAQVWIDSSTHKLAVSFNGQSEEFTAAQVSSITYKGGASGGDTFVNNTSRTSLAWGYGGANKFTGGTGFNYTYFFGNHNTFTAQGGISDVWEGYGVGDIIVNPKHAPVTVYAY